MGREGTAEDQCRRPKLVEPFFELCADESAHRAAGDDGLAVALPGGPCGLPANMDERQSLGRQAAMSAAILLSVSGRSPAPWRGSSFTPSASTTMRTASAGKRMDYQGRRGASAQ
jgi:hypothetical protein